MKIRTGIGLDVHSFEENRGFYLGGVKIPYHKGLMGHSDADALIHAIIDALHGAAGLADIGTFFPDDNQLYKNIRSTELLKKTAALLAEKNISVSNIDTIICLEKPKIASFTDLMKSTLAEILKISIDDIGIKATTFEKMGFIGSEDGVMCLASCLLISE